MTPRTVAPIVAPVLATLVLLTGCAAQSASSAGEPVTSSTTAASSPVGASTDAVVSSADGVPCPPSNLEARPISDGLPATTFPCLGPGPAVNLAGLRGKPVVLNVWASWCPPCRAEMPLITDLAADAGESLVVLGIDVDDDPQAAVEFAAAAGLASVIDPDSITRVTLGWSGPPVTYFVRSDGVIAHRSYGAIPDAATLRELVATHLGVQVPDA